MTEKSQYKGILLPSGPTPRDDTSSLLIKGIEAHQIFSTNQYIFKITATRDTMYRFRYDPRTNGIKESSIFERVQQHDAAWTDFHKIIVRGHIVSGTSRVFFGERYSLIELFGKNNKRKGYKFVPTSMQNPPDMYCMYFIFKGKEAL